MVRNAPGHAHGHIVDDGAHSVAPETLRRPVHPERERSWRGRPRVAKDDSDLTLRTAASTRSLVDGGSVSAGTRMERHKSFCMRHHIDGLAAEGSDNKKKKVIDFMLGNEGETTATTTKTTHLRLLPHYQNQSKHHRKSRPPPLAIA